MLVDARCFPSLHSSEMTVTGNEWNPINQSALQHDVNFRKEIPDLDWILKCRTPERHKSDEDIFIRASWGCMREPKKPGCWTWRKDTVQATYELCILHFRHQRNDERNFLPIREPVRTTARLATVRQHAEPGSSHQTHTTDDENSSCDSFDRWSAKPLTSCVYQAYSISLGA